MNTKQELLDRICALMPDARGQVEKILADYRVAKDTSRDSSTLDRQITVFLAAKKIDGLSVRTIKNYREILSAFALEVDKPAARISTDDIRAYIGYLSESRKLKDSSIQTYVNTLRSFFGWLDMEDLIKKNPMRKIKSLKIDKLRARRPLSPEELEQLRDGCRTYKEKALVEFLVSSGCRLGEAAGIQVDRIDWQSRSVVVLGKGNKERTVYFSVRAKLMLQAYLDSRRGGTAMFASSRKPYAPMTPRAIEKAIQKIGERAGENRRIFPHILRHTFATNALHGGMDLTIIQHLLGHSDPKTTMIYAELRDDAIKYAYEKVVA